MAHYQTGSPSHRHLQCLSRKSVRGSTLMREGPIIESAVITDKFVIMTNEVRVWFKKRYVGLIVWQLHQRLLAG